MPNWNELLNEIRNAGSTHDVVRRKYLQALHELTGRNVIVYYSGWLQKQSQPGHSPANFQLTDEDKTGFMSAIHGLDRSKGLDLLLHTPGGDAAATESLVHYLREMFDTDIRAIVPQIAMSAGTMLACACREIVMGRHSNLGPIDPQVGGLAAHGIIEEFKRAKKEIADNNSTIPVWQPIIGKYNPTLIGECEKVIEWAEEMVKDWLITGMFSDDEDQEDKAQKVLDELGDHAMTKSHTRHISMKRADDMGLVVNPLEDDDELQEAILSVHHACIQTLEYTAAVKLIENHDGIAFVRQVRQVLTQG